MAMNCVKYLPFIVSTSVLNASVFMTCLCGWLYAGEKLSKEELVCVAGGFAGVLLLLNPSFFSGLQLSDLALKMRVGADLAAYPRFNLGLMFGGLFAIFSAMKFITIRAIGDNVHSSLKNYYFGILSTLTCLTGLVFSSPNFFKPWLIGTVAYPLNQAQLIAATIVGLFGFASQETLTLALGSIKSGTVAAFQNIAIVLGFLIDILYFKRQILRTDIIGAGMIVLFTTLQGYFSNKNDGKKTEERREEVTK